MDAVTLDQFAVFVAIVDAGSFAAAARRMNRAQSAITYAIQKLEDQSGVTLFDRAAYRPALTEAGHALLPRARRIVESVADYGALAGSIAKGLEAEVFLVLDAFVPMADLVATLSSFRTVFPLVQIRIAVESTEAALQAMSQGWGDLALMAEFMPPQDDIERNVCGMVELVPVAAPDHPLARMPGPIEPEFLRDHVQLVFSARAALPESRDFGIHAVNRWYVTDLDIKHALLRAGLGWGSMPRGRVAADLETGHLVALSPARWEGIDRMPRFPLVVARRRDKRLGPAGRWLVERFSAAAPEAQPSPGDPRRVAR